MDGGILAAPLSMNLMIGPRWAQSLAPIQNLRFILNGYRQPYPNRLDSQMETFVYAQTRQENRRQ